MTATLPTEHTDLHPRTGGCGQPLPHLWSPSCTEPCQPRDVYGYPAHLGYNTADDFAAEQATANRSLANLLQLPSPRAAATPAALPQQVPCTHDALCACPKGTRWAADAGTAQLRHHSLADLPRGEDGQAPRYLDHRQIAAAQAVAQLLAALQVPTDEHTADTPARVAKAYLELLRGYETDPADHLERNFPGPEGDAGPVVLAGIRFTSLCAHHLLPFTGTATVAYLPQPGGAIVGLSKLARVLEGYAARLQTQEVLGAQVVAAVEQRLAGLGAACVITSAHQCMGIRGVRQPDAAMTTTSVRGLYATDTALRAELLALHLAERPRA